MKTNLTRALFAFLLATLPLQHALAQGEVHIYNWSDYIAEDTVANFEQAAGIETTYDVYDSNEVLEAKLLAGKSGYDVIFPTARPTADRHIKAGLYLPLDKSALPHYGNIDPAILASLAGVDPGNRYLVPYMWGTTGIGINVDKVKAILGDEFPLDSWRLLYDPAVVSRLAACGVTLIDDAAEVFISARIWRGLDTSDFSTAAMEEAAATVTAVRPYFRYFHNSQYINDLANGDICVAQGYSGDVLQARDRAAEANNGVTIAYLVPAEGALMWTDTMAIPVDAPNVQAAHRFIDYLLQPEVIASITDYVAYANANLAATALVDESIRNDPGIYPAEATRRRLFVQETPSDREIRGMNRIWTRVKTGQ